MDRVNRALQGTNDLDQMMRDVLGVVLAIFDCDRAWLFYPCDQDATSFRVPMEITRPEYPGAGILNVDVPLPSDMAQNLREALESPDPVTYAAGTEKPINKVSAEQFGVKAMMMTALYPRSGKPWAFGLHQCSYARTWTSDELRLFQEIGRRLADGLSSLLFFRDLREEREHLEELVDDAHGGTDQGQQWARIGEQGAGGVCLFGLARPQGAAPGDRRLFPHPAGGLFRQGRCRGPAAAERRARQHGQDGPADRRHPGVFAGQAAARSRRRRSTWMERSAPCSRNWSRLSRGAS